LCPDFYMIWSCKSYRSHFRIRTANVTFGICKASACVSPLPISCKVFVLFFTCIISGKDLRAPQSEFPKKKTTRTELRRFTFSLPFAAGHMRSEECLLSCIASLGTEEMLFQSISFDLSVDQSISGYSGGPNSLPASSVRAPKLPSQWLVSKYVWNGKDVGRYMPCLHVWSVV